MSRNATGASEPVGSTTIETPAQLQRFPHCPVTFTQQSGTLRLAGRRLTFTRSRGRQVFDGDLGDFHSFAPCYAGLGFHLWQGRHRYVLVFQRYGVPPLGSLGLVGLALSIEATRQAGKNLPKSLADARLWQHTLAPLITSRPPQGVQVRPPLSTPKYWAAVCGAVLGIVIVGLGLIFAAVVLTG